MAKVRLPLASDQRRLHKRVRGLHRGLTERMDSSDCTSRGLFISIMAGMGRPCETIIERRLGGLFMHGSSKLLGGFLLGALTLAVGLGPGCGGGNDSSFPNDAGGDTTSADSGNDTDIIGDSGPGFTGLGDGSTGVNTQCNTNWCLKRVSCPNGGDTTVSGIVYDPAGKVPLYNALVFVPNEDLKPITSGPSCDRCDGSSNVYSGAPVTYAQTNYKGEFTLHNVPVDDHVPLVVQLGKWRREKMAASNGEFVQLTVKVAACTSNDYTPTDKHLEYKDLTRLPKSHNEGNIPKIAITTGALDSMECWPRRMGIEDDYELKETLGTYRAPPPFLCRDKRERARAWMCRSRPIISAISE